MKRWATMTLSVAAIVGVGYLGEKSYLSSQQHDQEIEHRIAALTIQVSDLNDRFIAASRDEKNDTANDSTNAVSGLTLSMTQIFPLHWLKQTLQLAQSQLEFNQQTSPVNAFESTKNTLNLVKSNLNSLVAGHAISELPASALTRAIDIDLKMIDSEAQTHRQEIQLLDRHIAQLQLTLDAMARQGPSMQVPSTVNNLLAQAGAAPTAELSFTQRISRLFVIEKPALNVRENMMQRGLICREVALTLGLARQALGQGQSDRVVQLMADSQAQLAGVVDPAAKQMQSSIAALKVPAHPKLQLTALQWAPAEALITPVKPVTEISPSPASAVTVALPSAPRVVAS
ncbi:MAG: hypothetical protein NVS3B3_00330 [Aquirhabdus sp.]